MRYLDKLSSEWTQKRVDSARRRWSAMKNRCYNPNDAAITARLAAEKEFL